MPSIVADIENLKRELERAHSELLQMYQELGETSFAWHDAISYEPSQEPYDKLAGLVNEKEDIDRRIEALKTAVSEPAPQLQHRGLIFILCMSNEHSQE